MQVHVMVHCVQWEHVAQSPRKLGSVLEKESLQCHRLNQNNYSHPAFPEGGGGEQRGALVYLCLSLPPFASIYWVCIHPAGPKANQFDSKAIHNFQQDNDLEQNRARQSVFLCNQLSFKHRFLFLLPLYVARKVSLMDKSSRHRLIFTVV